MIVRRFVGLLVLLLSLVILVWSIWPIRHEARSVVVLPGEIQLPEEAGAFVSPALAAPAILEDRLLTLEWPDRVRVGDDDVIRLLLEMDVDGGLVVETQVPENEGISQTQEIPNLYDTHNVLAEARLEMVGVEYAPRGLVTEALLPSRPVVFLWNVRSKQAGDYKGTVWLSLRFISQKGGAEQHAVLSAQIFEVQAKNFLGLSGKAARVVGSIGMVAGIIFGLDNLLPRLRRLICRSSKPSKSA